MILKNWPNRLTLIGLLLSVTFGCGKNDCLPDDPLDRLNWSERNWTVLNEYITDYGKGGPYYDKEKPPYAVLDWDQTCSYLDCEEALLHYQLTHFRLKLTKAQFEGVLKDEVNGVRQLSDDYHGVFLKDLNLDLISDYSFLSDNYSGLNGTLSLEQIRATPQYADFITKVAFLYDGYCGTSGIGTEYGYPWVIGLLAGHTTSEIREMARDAITFGVSDQLRKQTWSSPDELPGIAGVISYSFKTGLRVLPEMQNLISTLTTYGIDVFIVSASFKPVVETFSGIGRFGYNISPDQVIAMEMDTTAEGIILTDYKNGWVQTQKQGKVEAINRVIKQELGRDWDPIFSAGDSDGDYEMLTGFPDTKLTLIWNRVKGGNIGLLCRQAVDEMASPKPRYILQGRNENAGLAIPCSESVLFGESVAKLLYQ